MYRWGFGRGRLGWALDWEGMGSVSDFGVPNLFDVGIRDEGGFWMIVEVFLGY